MHVDQVCQHLRSEWDRVRSALRVGIKEAYRNSGLNVPEISEDQQYYLSSLYLIVTAIKAQHVIQTGTLAGHSTLAIAFALEHNRGRGIVETVDPEPSQYGGPEPKNPVHYARAVISSCKLSNRVVFHRGYSVKAWDSERQDLPEAPEAILPELARYRQTDLLVVDGDHTFSGTFWDLEIGCRALRPDGARLIHVHDYSSIPEVRKAVRTWVGLHKGETDYRVWSRHSGFALIQFGQVPAAQKGGLSWRKNQKV